MEPERQHQEPQLCLRPALWAYCAERKHQERMGATEMTQGSEVCSSREPALSVPGPGARTPENKTVTSPALFENFFMSLFL